MADIEVEAVDSLDAALSFLPLGLLVFANLLEGIYEVRIQPTTKAGYSSSTPATALYQIVGLADVETAQFNFQVN